MRAVKGRVVSARPVSLSRAAAVMSAFAGSDNGAPRELAAYIRRASRAFDDLLRLHREIRERRKKPDLEARADGSAGADEDGTRNKKRGNRSDEVSGGELIPRHSDGDDSGGIEEERRRRKKRRRREGLDSAGEGELILRLADGEDEGDEMRKKKWRKDGGELGIGVEKSTIGVQVENENIVEGGEKPLEDRDDGGSKRKKKKKKRRGNEEDGETGSNEKNVGVVEEKPEKRKKRKEKKNGREKGLMEDGVGEILDDGGWDGGGKKGKHFDNGGGGDVLEGERHKRKKNMKVKEQ